VITSGKRKEQALFDSFGGRPTERMLCHEHASNKILVAERHRQLAKLFPKVKIPTADSEKKDRRAALEVYAACVYKMRAQARANKEKFPHVHRENVHYGFRRNLWGLKPYAVAITLVSLIVVSADMVGQLMAHQQIHLAVPAIAGVDLLLLVTWILVVNRDWMRRGAILYAERLLEALDVLA
jgi:hypothetical protein